MAVCCLVCLHFPGLSGNLQVTSSCSLSMRRGHLLPLHPSSDHRFLFWSSAAALSAKPKPNTKQRLRCDQHPRASLVVQAVENLPAMQETWVWSLSREGPWGIPWAQKLGCYRGSLAVMMRSQRVGHDSETNSFTFTLNTLHTPQLTRGKENSKIREKKKSSKYFYQGWLEEKIILK